MGGAEGSPRTRPRGVAPHPPFEWYQPWHMEIKKTHLRTKSSLFPPLLPLSRSFHFQSLPKTTLEMMLASLTFCTQR
jgi:hypothetical protein